MERAPHRPRRGQRHAGSRRRRHGAPGREAASTTRTSQRRAKPRSTPSTRRTISGDRPNTAPTSCRSTSRGCCAICARRRSAAGGDGPSGEVSPRVQRAGRAVRTVWRFFERPLDVAQCMPGVEWARAAGGRGRQLFRPRHAEARADGDHLPGQGPHHRAASPASGSSSPPRERPCAARSATSGRGTPSRSTADGAATRITVEGEVALAGVLGSVGSAVINRQAEKTTAEFACNLERALSAADEPSRRRARTRRRPPLSGS